MYATSYHDKYLMSSKKTKGSFSLEINDVYRIGSYEIFLNNPIGIGGYSVVYYGRCIDDELINKYNLHKTKFIENKLYNNIVAVKKILVRDSSTRVKKAIFDEVSIMRGIITNPHPNIVTCYDIIDDIDTIYIIMEYCENGDLGHIIGKPMKEETVKYYFKQLINGIKYMNENQIIHRDIKPKNILLTDENRTLKICDFGLAKNKSGLSRVNTICGSPLYMAPEMFYDKSYDETVDIWSVGIILYEMLYGINPFHKIKDKHELEQFMINSTDEIKIPPKQTKNKDVSEQCLSLLRDLLQKTSSTRITFNKLYIHEWMNQFYELEFKKSDISTIDESENDDNNNSNNNNNNSNNNNNNNNNSNSDNNGNNGDDSLMFDMD